MINTKNEYIAENGLRISMPLSGVIRVTDGKHKSSYMISAKLRKVAPKVNSGCLRWGKITLEPENDMRLCLDGKELFRDYTSPRTHTNAISIEELAQLHAEGHTTDGIVAEDWPVEVCKTLAPGDAVYGLGDKTGFLNKRGYAFENWNTDDPSPHVDSHKSLYKSINFFIISGKNGCCGILADNTYRTRFDFGKENPGYFSFSHAGGGLDYYMIPGKDLKAVLRKYLQLTGASQLQQKWVYGFQQSHWSYASAAEVLEVAKTMRNNHIPLDVIYMDIDYMDGFRVFTFDKGQFAEPKQLSAELADLNIKPVTIIDPGVKKDSGYFVYDEGVRDGHFATNPDGSVYVGKVWPGDSVFPDFTQEKTRVWWGEKLKILLDNGIRGIWNDMNEPANFTGPLPDDVQFHGGDHLEVHNVYGHLMAQATYEGLLKLENRRPFVLTRACCAGSQRYCSGWTGDNHSLWAHIQLSLVQMMNLGLSGMYMNGSDIGGFGSDCTPELLVRWTQAGCLAPFFRNHYAKGTRAQEPYAFDEKTMELCRDAINLRYHLLPYIYDLAHEDMPILRPMVLEYPEDPECADLCDQYLVGDKLLVAPVMTPGSHARAVYLPKGTWYDYYTGKKYAGGKYILADAPINKLPLFAKAGAILPVAVGQPQSVEDIRDVVLEVFPGNGNFVHYADDGETMAHLDGDYHALKVSVRGTEVSQEVIHNGYNSADRLNVILRA